MVCISCILIPIGLFLWHRFLRPFFYAYFPSWAPAVEKKVDNMTNGSPGGKCPISGKETGGGGDGGVEGKCPAATNGVAAHSNGVAVGGGDKKTD